MVLGIWGDQRWRLPFLLPGRSELVEETDKYTVFTQGDKFDGSTIEWVW